VTVTVVVAPHPDDEVLGASAVLLGREAIVVHVTDGVPPWTDTAARAATAATRRAECRRAWAALACTAELAPLGFGDLTAWRSVEEIAAALCAVVGPLGPAEVYVPAYQRGHPDHDATSLAASLARDHLGGDATTWWAYALYGYDRARSLRFGWLPRDMYGTVDERAGGDVLEAKARALRRFTSQLWPGSALDSWLRAPVAEQFAPLPTTGAQPADLPFFYDEALGFGRYGASAAEVEATFARTLAARAEGRRP